MRAIGPGSRTTASMPGKNSSGGESRFVRRPEVGRRPWMPQKWAGVRMLPPMSAASPSGEPPAAMIAPSPPLPPPLVRSRSHGLFVRPKSGLSPSW